MTVHLLLFKKYLLLNLQKVWKLLWQRDQEERFHTIFTIIPYEMSICVMCKFICDSSPNIFHSITQLFLFFFGDRSNINLHITQKYSLYRVTVKRVCNITFLSNLHYLHICRVVLFYFLQTLNKLSLTPW